MITILRRAWPVLYLLLITGLVYQSVLLPGQTLLPADLLLLTPPWRQHTPELFPGFHSVQIPAWDPLFQFYPARKFLADSILSGHIPLWNPLALSGTPFAADGQSAVFYPINWLFAVLPLPSAFGWVAALHTFLAGLFFYGYGRRVGWSKIAALCGATSWMLCGVMIAFQMWQVVASTLCWLPLALYFWEGWRQSGDRRQLAGMAVALGLSLLAGHLQFAFYVWITSIAYAIARPAPSERAPRIRSAAMIAAACLLGIGIAGVQLFLTADMLPHTSRSGSSYSEIAGLCLPLSQMIMLIAPDFFGGIRDWTHHSYIGVYNYWELTAFCGAAAFAFGLFGIRLRAAGDLSRFCVGLAVFALLMGFGSPLLAVFYYGVPFFKSFHGPARIFVLFDFAVAALCAQGVQRLMEASVEERRKLAGYLSIGLFSSLLIGYRIAVQGNGPLISQALTHDWLGYGLTQIGIAALAIGLACGLLAKAPPRFVWLALPLVAADMVWFAASLNANLPSKLLYPQTDETRFVSSHLEDARVLCLGDGNPHHDQTRMTPNSAMSLGWRDVSGSDPLILKNYSDFLAALNNLSPSALPVGQGMVAAVGSPMLDRLNVKYVVTPASADIPGYKNVYGGDVNIYANANALGPARLEPNWQAVTDNAQALTQILGLNRHGILLDRRPEFSGASSHPMENRLRELVNKSGDIEINASAAQPQILVSQEVNDPGWKAEIDGRPAQTLTADTIQLAVPLSAGEHKISLRYLPASGQVGLYLSLVAWGIVAGVMGASRKIK